MLPENIRASAVFVTGAAGFIGSALCERLVAGSHSVVGYDNLSRGRPAYLPAGTPLIEGDIRDAARTEAAIAECRPGLVIHLAAMHFIPECLARPRDTMDVNVTGTRVVLDACRRHSVDRVMFASSAAVYMPSDEPCREDSTPLRPLEVYGESKLAGERLAGRFHEETGIPTTILRLFNAVGRRETNPHVVPHIFESLRKGDVVELGNLTPRRDYIDTRDVADAILAAAASPGRLSVFNVGTGVAYSVSDIVERLARILGRRLEIAQEPSRVRATERMLLLADITRMREATGWKPRLSLDETLADVALEYNLQAQPYSKS